MEKVLLIDDDRAVRLLVERGLAAEDRIVITAGTAHDGLRLLESEKPQVALIDIMMPDINGLELFRKIRAIDQKIPMIFVTADSSSETTIEAMRLGAFDYVSKPINLDQLRKLTQSAQESRRLMEQPIVMPLHGNGDVGERFVGRSEPMVEVFKSIGRVSDQNVTVLVRGESGCGKELVARAIVQHSDRVNKPFITVNCAAIPDQLLESELFGHEKGAFTGAEKRRIGKFEECDGGTLFLDEVGDMSVAIQGKVLRLLQEQRFHRVGGNDEISTDVRIISATNQPLEEMVKDGRFREDLLYRLNGYTIALPPLRDRRDDIPLLLEYFFRRVKKEMSKDALDGLAPATLELLTNYPWPGNVRQLQSVVRHSVLHATGKVLGPDSLPSFVQTVASSPPPVDAGGLTVGLPVELPSGDTDATLSLNPNHDVLPTSPNGSYEHQNHATNPVEDNNSRPLNSLSQFIEQRLAEHSENLYAEILEEMERYLFKRVLQETDGNQSKAAEILGITRGKVRDRIQSFKIHVERVISS